MDWLPLTTEVKLNHFVDLVMDGEYIPPPPFRELMYKSLADCLDYESLMATEDNQRRVNIVSSSFPRLQFQRLLVSLDHALTKNDEVTKVLMKRGDEFMNAGNNQEALHCYSLALCFAPTNATNTADIYMNRSDILFDFGKYESALMDLENAEMGPSLQDQADRNLVIESKKMACEDALVPLLKDEEILKREEYRDEIIGKVHCKNHLPLSGLPDFISVKYNKYRGRYLVASKALNPGTTVLVEEAYVSVVVDQLKWQTRHCNRCLKETLNPIPCKECVYNIYCGHQCRIEDKSHGHEHECPILPYLHSMKMARNFHLCFKAICKAGPVVLKKLYMKSKSVKYVEDAWFVPVDATHTNSDRYSQVLNMASQNRFFDLPFSAWLAVSLAHALRLKTTFFNTIEEIEKSGFEKFIAVIIMHHSESFPYNTMTIGDNGNEVTDIKAYYESGQGGMIPILAAGIFTSSNLMNHSCVPTAFRQDLPEGRVAIITNKTLKPGEELSHGYGFDFMKDPIWKRQNDLYEYFRITCDCVACVENWPLLKDMRTLIFTYVCQPCKNHIQDLLAKSPIKEIKPNKFKCVDCITQSDPNIEPCKSLSYVLEIANDLVIKNRPLEALPLLTECIKNFEKDRQPSSRLIFAQTRLMDSYNLITNTIKHGEVETQMTLYEQLVDKMFNFKENYCSIF